jgi:hypothetical protein
MLKLFGPGLNGVHYFSNAKFPTLPGDAGYARCFQVKVIFDGELCAWMYAVETAEEAILFSGP